MRRIARHHVTLALALAAALLSGGVPGVRAADVLIGTGAAASLPFQLGRAICRMVEIHARDVECNPLETTGALFNLANVRGGAIEFAIVPSDWQYHAVNRTGPFEFADDDYGNLRALFSLHAETLTLVARRDAGVRGLVDLPGRRVNIGNPGSPQRAAMDAVMAAKNWTKHTFPLVTELPAGQQSLAFCHDRVQAMVYSVAHPNAAVARVLDLCDARVVPVARATADAIVGRHAYYLHSAIPEGMYAGMTGNVQSFGVKATLVSSTDVDPALVRAVVAAVFDNLPRLRRMHPALGALEPHEMATEGLSAPLHDGATAYFKSKGLM